MQIRGKGVSYARVCQIVKEVSEDTYDGNVIVHPDARAIRDDYGFTGRLRQIDSRGPGSRTSASWMTERHGPWTCWHAYRDVLRAILTEYPHATIRTHMATYRGLAGFEETYPDTAYVNVGAPIYPRYMPDLCDCGGWR